MWTSRGERGTLGKHSVKEYLKKEKMVSTVNSIAKDMGAGKVAVALTIEVSLASE